MWIYMDENVDKIYMEENVDKDEILKEHKDDRICIVLDKNGRALTDTERAGCMKMMDDCYPEGHKDRTVFIEGTQAHDREWLISVMKARPDLHLVITHKEDQKVPNVISRNEESGEVLRLIPSGAKFTPMLTKIVDESWTMATDDTTWQFFNAYLNFVQDLYQSALEKYRK